MSERTLVVVVTGLSGAGKSTALHALEDLGFFCVDNLPPPVVAPTLASFKQAGVDRAALGIDVRVRFYLDQAQQILDEVKSDRQRELAVLFLDASDEALIRRFSGTRRPHPLSTVAEPGDQQAATALLEGINIERERLAALRARATLILDTTALSVHELRRRILQSFGPGAGRMPRMQTRFVSFGFKYGTPVDADLVFDLRFLQNPFFVPELKPQSGKDAPVRDFVLELPDAQELLGHLQSLLEFCLPRFEAEGKSYLTVAIGCTGGRHRSVVFADELAKRLGARGAIEVVHRDLGRDILERRNQPEVAATGHRGESG